MAKGILNVVADKIFPVTAPVGNQTENNSPRALLFSQPITRGDADAALNHITGQFVARQNPATQTAPINQDGDNNQKTVTDFLRQIQNSQPFDEAALSKKKEHVELKLSKPPEKLSVADYDRATWRAIFNKAGYSLLTDAEVGMAVQAMKNTGYKSTNDGFSLSNLRRFDAKPGPMFVGTDGATIEKAKQAGQAVLQYQEYKAKGIDAAVEKGQNYATEALGGFIEKPYNAVANNVNGLSEPFRAGERKLFGTSYLPELPRSTVGDRSEYWQQKRYGGVTLNMMGEGAATIQVGVMTGKPLYNSRVGALLGVQVGAYNIGVGATGNDPLHPGREMSGLERGSRIIGGTFGIPSAPFSPGGRALSNSTFRTIDKLDDIFKNPPTVKPQGEMVTPEGFGIKTNVETVPDNVLLSKAKAQETNTIGRRNLDSHEGVSGVTEGKQIGHTLLKHVGKSEKWLQDRIRNEGVREASSFYNESVGNRTVGRFIKENKEAIQQWAKNGKDEKFRSTIDMQEKIGIVVNTSKKGTPLAAEQATKAKIVLVKDNSEYGWHLFTVMLQK